jgi:hypothetical protein
MNQGRSNSCQKIKIEISLPPQFIFYKNTKNPKKDGVSQEVPEIGVKKHGSD